MGDSPGRGTQTSVRPSGARSTSRKVNRPQRRVAVAVVAAAALIITLLAWPWVRVYTGEAPPKQFDRPLASPVDTGQRDVLTIAHNAGNNAETTAAALKRGADVIEIDVITVQNTLAAGRVYPWRWLAERVFRGETLNEAWEQAEPAKMIQLDLQETDRGLLDALIGFLRQAPAGQRVLVSTRDADAILYLRPRLASAVTLLYSVPFPEAVQRVQTNRALADAIGGITVFQGLVDADLTAWAHERGLLVLAWTVDDAKRLDALLRLGVDSITTNNLAVIGALSR
jgi:glycerophosphoryl diester phosphodiesterase